MADFHSRYPQNVAGKFYLDDQGLDHDLCAELCPKHFKRNDKGGHYDVYKQPETAEEIARCLQAVDACPIHAIGSRWRPTAPGRTTTNEALVAFLVGDGLLFQINVCKPDVRSIFFAHGAVVDSQRASKK